MSSTDDSSSSDSVVVVKVNTPETRVDARRLLDGMPPGVDRMGALPDEILHYLLSLLPVQEAVRTSVLAQRWRYLWKSTTGLRIVGTKGPGSVQSLRKFVDHLLVLRERVNLDTVEIEFREFREEDVRSVNQWIGFAVQSKVHALTVCQTNVLQPFPFHLHGLPFTSRHLTTLGLYGVRIFLDFSDCPALEDLMISCSIINVSKIASRSLKHLTICPSIRGHWFRLSAPCLVSLKLEGFSDRTPLLDRMPLLETAFLRLDHYTPPVMCCATNVFCLYCLPYDHGRGNSVLGAVYNATHLELISSLGMTIFTSNSIWWPTFNNLKNLLLGDYWCVGPDFSALTCILRHSPVLEKLTLHLVSKGVRPIVEMKGCYRSMERSTVLSEHLKIVNVKCNVVDEKVAEVLRFLYTLNLRFCFV